MVPRRRVSRFITATRVCGKGDLLPGYDDTEYALASITEFGVATANYREVLDDLRTRQQQRQSKGFDCDHGYAAVMGSTDLIEISRFNHYFHLSAVGGSSAQAFRRSIGVLCPRAEDLAGSRPEVCRLGQALAPSEATPLLAVMYLKQSPLSALCRTQAPADGTEGGSSKVWSPVQQRLLRHIGWNEEIWHSYRDVLTATLPAPREDSEAGVRVRFGDEPPSLPTIKVAPLLGLDSVEVVLVVRAACLEQMAALAFVMRHQTLERVWPVVDDSSALKAVRQLLAQPVSLEDWNCSPLFSDTTTVVGMPLRPPGRGTDGEANDDWHLERANPEGCAARQAIIIKRSRLVGGGRPERLVPSTQIDDAVAEQAAPSPPTELAFLMLFDRNDALDFKTDAAEAVSYVPPLRRLDFSELQGHLVQLLSYAASPHAEADPRLGSFRPVRTALSVAVRVVVPYSAVSRGLPNQDLLITFHNVLRACRHAHLNRGGEGLWTHQWLERTKELGTIYSLTNSGVNLIASVLDYLEDDLEGFIDLLPVIQHLVWMVGHPVVEAGKEHLVHSDLVWFYRQAETLATSRGRRDHPLRLPRDTLSFEGHAGYRTSRDACQAFLESLADIGVSGKRGQVMLLDSSGDGISCRPGRFDSIAVSASAMVLHHPFYWGVFAHELGHSLFRHTLFGDREQPLGLAGEALKKELSPSRSVFYDSSWRIKKTETIKSLFDQTETYLRRHSFQNEMITPLTKALARAIEEVPADYLLWRTLFEDLEDERREDLFWFLVGPSLMFTVQHDLGSVGPDPTTIGSIIIRWFAASRWTAVPPGGEHGEADARGDWLEDLHDLVWFLNGENMKDAVDGDCYRQNDSSLNRTLYRFKCFKKDLRIADRIWFLTTKHLLQALGTLRDVDEGRDGEPEASGEKKRREEVARVRALTKAWLELVPVLGRHCIEALPEESPGRVYIDYLTELWAICEQPSPWLPMVPSHEIGPADKARWTGKARPEIAIARRGGILASGESLHAYNEATLRFISSLHEQARQSRYDKLRRYIQEASG